MATKIQPLGQRVLVKRVDEEETSAGGIILPDTAKEKPQEAEIVLQVVGDDLLQCVLYKLINTIYGPTNNTKL